MPDYPHFPFLQLLVALSVYIAAVRIFLLGRKPITTSIKNVLFVLMFADVFLVAAAIAMVADVFWLKMTGYAPWSWLFPFSMYTFGAAILVLCALHVHAWTRTVKAFCHAPSKPEAKQKAIANLDIACTELAKAAGELKVAMISKPD
jgi:hypothetical protein